MKKWMICLSLIFSMNIALATQEQYKQEADAYWNDFKTAYTARQVRNISEWLNHLATPAPEMTLEKVHHNQRAIEYFLATGGRHGFANRVATAEEKNLCSKAIRFIAISSGPDMPSSSGFLAWRDGLQLPTTQESIKNHLAFVEIEYRAAKILKYGQVQVHIGPSLLFIDPYSVTAADTYYCRMSLPDSINLIPGIDRSILHQGIVRLLGNKQWQESVKDINDCFYREIYRDAPVSQKGNYPRELEYDTNIDSNFASAVNNVFNKGTSFTRNHHSTGVYRTLTRGEKIHKTGFVDVFTLPEGFQLKLGYYLPALSYQVYYNGQAIGTPQTDALKAQEIYKEAAQRNRNGTYVIERRNLCFEITRAAGSKNVNYWANDSIDRDAWFSFELDLIGGRI